mmetsp:Transcript_27701/g.55531  ORF Transcript_27701/g.55531 Transcript_27701/m.55531 type:complete len:93 (-) Transcript_27701:161-439(-)
MFVNNTCRRHTPKMSCLHQRTYSTDPIESSFFYFVRPARYLMITCLNDGGLNVLRIFINKFDPVLSTRGSGISQLCMFDLLGCVSLSNFLCL